MVLCDPGGELRGGPGALRLSDLGAHGVEDRRREGGVFAAAGFVDQGIKPAVEEGFEPGADGLLMLAKVASNPWGAPAGVGEANHLQAVAGTGRKTTLTGTLAQLRALCIGEGDTVHGEKHTKFHELPPPTHLGYLPTEPAFGPALYELIAGRYDRKPTIITSNKSLSEWATIVQDVSLAAAIVDRLMHHGQVIYLKGPSWRTRGRTPDGETERDASG